MCHRVFSDLQTEIISIESFLRQIINLKSFNSVLQLNGDTGKNMMKEY